MGVSLSVALLCHFFSPVRSPSPSPVHDIALQNRTIGGVCLRRRGNDFFPLARKGKWENWERRWLYVEVDAPSACLRLPQGPLPSNSRWSEMP